MKKNKKIILIVSIAIVSVGAIFGIIKFKKYYDNRYVESDVVYLKVPQDQSTELDDMYDMSGNVVDTGKEYKFTAYSKSEKAVEVEFSVYTEDEDKLLKPGDYLKVSVSNTLVLNEWIIDETEVPRNVLEILNNQ